MLDKHTDIYLSIIIPFYNSEKKLKKCINSILKQNSSKLEILLINDGSTDRSINICKKLKKSNKNIHIINKKKNLGVSSSRNDGIKKAKGNFLIFLDSDDYLLNGSIKKIIKLVEKNKTKDLIIFRKFIAHSMEKTFIIHKIFQTQIKNNNTNELFEKLYNEKKIYGNIYNYVVNRNFLFEKKIFFSKGVNFAEDQEFVVKILTYCTQFYFSNQAFYCYRSGSGTLSSSMTYSTALSCLKVTYALIKLKKFNSLPIIKKKYINKIINKVLNEFVPRLIYIEKKESIKLAQFIEKNKNYFNFINFSFLKSKIFPISKSFDYGKKIIKFRKILSDKIEKITKAETSNQIYIFCLNYYGIAIAKILKNRNFDVRGFIDNNELLTNKKISGLKVFSPKILRKISENQRKNILVIITNKFKKNIANITKQLIKLKIKNEHIISIAF